MKHTFIALLFLWLPTTTLAQQLTVARIVDGDTIELSDGRTIRLIGVDTPEMHQSAKLNRDAERTGQEKATIRRRPVLMERTKAFSVIVPSPADGRFAIPSYGKLISG